MDHTGGLGHAGVGLGHAGVGWIIQGWVGNAGVGGS